MTPIHKRVPVNMAYEYVARGWTIAIREGRTVILYWTKEGAPE